jgi:AbrB family looped-hinge helix DNA binding protein
MSTIAIDRFGRVVIPKGIRERMSWTEGTELDVREDAEGLHLVAIHPPASGSGLVVREQGVVYDATWDGPADADAIRSALGAARDDQADHQAAWRR